MLPHAAIYLLIIVYFLCAPMLSCFLANKKQYIL